MWYWSSKRFLPKYCALQSSMFPGMGDRIQKEINLLLAPSSPRESARGTDIKVIAPPDRNFSTWVGGSLLASLSIFEDICISKKEYEVLPIIKLNYIINSFPRSRKHWKIYKIQQTISRQRIKIFVMHNNCKKSCQITVSISLINNEHERCNQFKE